MADADDPVDDLYRAQEAEIERVLKRSPNAHIGAVRGDGIMTQLPAGLSLQPGHRPTMSRTVVDIVTWESAAAVLSAWEQVRSSNHARCQARLRVDESYLVDVEFFDVRARFGVFLVVISPTDKSEQGSERRSSIAVPIAPRIGRVRKSTFAEVLDADDNALTMLGFKPEQMIGMRSLDLIHPDDQTIAIDNWLEMLSAPGQTLRVRLRHVQGDGTYRWVEISNENHVGADGDGEVITEVIDISQEMATLELLREREQLLSRLAEALPLALLHFDLLGSIVYANERVAEITGVEASADLDTQLKQIVAGDREILLGAAETTLETGEPATVEVHAELEGRKWVCDVRIRAIEGTDGDVTGAIMCISDVTESVATRNELEERATFDFLTGCLNRESTIRALSNKLEHSSVGIAVVYVDLDDFKEMNDKYGHAMGDAVLVSLVERLQHSVRNGDQVGRLGGDEFVVISSGVVSNDGANVVAARVTEAIDHDIEWGGSSVAVKATVGVAWTAKPLSADTLIAQADEAMYGHKRRR